MSYEPLVWRKICDLKRKNWHFGEDHYYSLIPNLLAWFGAEAWIIPHFENISFIPKIQALFINSCWGVSVKQKLEGGCSSLWRSDWRMIKTFTLTLRGQAALYNYSQCLKHFFHLCFVYELERAPGKQHMCECFTIFVCTSLDLQAPPGHRGLEQIQWWLTVKESLCGKQPPTNGGPEWVKPGQSMSGLPGIREWNVMLSHVDRQNAF